MSLDHEPTRTTVSYIDMPSSRRYKQLDTELEDTRTAKSELIQKMKTENLQYSAIEDEIDVLELAERRILGEMQLLKEGNASLRASPFKRAMRHLGIHRDSAGLP